MKLPIKFTLKAKFILWVLTEQNPGKMMVALIDCLTHYEGTEVTDDQVCELYPDGFYTDDSVRNYVDNYCKTKLCKWSEIY